MKINVLVTGAVYASQSGYSALKFCQAAVNAGYTISQVFFYRDGVSQASSLSAPLDDEFNPLEHWCRFAESHGTRLVVCVSAAERRGILSEEQADDFSKEAYNLDPHFCVEGLGALHDASLSSDRTVTFK